MCQQATKVNWYNKFYAALRNVPRVLLCILVPMYSNSVHDLFTSVMHMPSVRCSARVDSLFLSQKQKTHFPCHN